MDAGPRTGVSIRDDQWVIGGHLRAALPCLGNIGFGPVLSLGVGGNYVTLRSSGRLDYLVWFDDAHTVGIYPAIGASAYFYFPVGGFATFCRRVDLEECWGHEVGWELGGGFRYRRLGVDAFAGFGGLPAVTIMAGVMFPLSRPEGR